MKVIKCVIFVIQFYVIFAITVPPSWHQNHDRNNPTRSPRISYKYPSVSTTLQPISSERFEFISFFPSDARPAANVQQLQYRPSNSQPLIISHPFSVQDGQMIEDHTPQSYQVVKFDNQEQDIPITHKIRQKNSRQHLTEVSGRPKQKVTQRSKNNSRNKYVPTRQHQTEVNSRQRNSPSAQQSSIKENVHNEEEDEDSSEEQNAPINEHEIARDVPTRPIYPGEGKWAKFGQKHRPYIRPESQSKDLEESEERPEGYDTFEKGEQQFQRAKNNYRHDINTFPERNRLKQSQISETDSSDQPLYEKPEIGFIPEKLYTQVRRTENEEHLPRSSIDPEEGENAGRLREIIKDKRIHTVYTEEGYEDSAYDHAGHEKNAENHEGHGKSHDDHSASAGRSKERQGGQHFDERGNRRGQNYERRKVQNADRSKNEDYSNSARYKKRNRVTNNDTDTANSEYDSKKVDTTTIPTKNVKKITLHNGKDNIDMEIHTEIKYTPQKKKHKFIKIIPSPQVNNTTEQDTKPLKRVKRYDKEKLSRRYIRKRPEYYWKKKTTTEPPINKMRQKFEAAFKFHSKARDDKFDPEIIGLTTQRTKINKPSTIRTATTTRGTTITSPTTASLATSSLATSSLPTASLTNSTTPGKEVSNTTVSTSSTTSTTVHPDLMNPELTTKLSKPATPKTLPVRIKKFQSKRQKRYTNDFPKLKVDLSEFSDVRKFPDPTQLPDLTHIKYPYYNMPVNDALNENSPLRYAEDMKNIPIKIENELSFYKSREHIKCPEIDRNVNPIPERIENQENGEETDKMAEKPDLPRLKGLGNKIDCLKEKYFGENPLDSPFFKEDTIKQPVPFFVINKSNGDLEKVSPAYLIDNKVSKNSMKRELKVRFLQPIVVLEEDLVESATLNPIHHNSEAVLKPPYTLTEIMDKNQFKPQNIYDQINLLENEKQHAKNEESSRPPLKQFIVVYDNEDNVKNISATAEPKQEMKYTIRPRIRKRPVEKLPAKTIRKPQRRRYTTTTTTEYPTTEVTTEATTTEAPTTTTTTTYATPTTTHANTPVQKVRIKQRQSENRPRPQVQQNNNWQTMNGRLAAFYNIFDISRYLPRVPNQRPLANEIRYRNSPKPIVPQTTTLYPNFLQNVNNQKEKKDESESRTQTVTEPVFKEDSQIYQSLREIYESAEVKNQEKKINQPSTEKIFASPPSTEKIIYLKPRTERIIEIKPSTTEKIVEVTPPTTEKIVQITPPTTSRTNDLISPSTNVPHIKILPSPKPTEKVEVTSASQRFNIFTFFNNLRRLKRDLSEDYNEDNDDLLVEESENRSVYTSISRNKPQYTEIVRQRPSRVETPKEEEDEEDLNPRKRYYEISSNKQRSTTSAPFYEEEFIEEIITEPSTTTSKPKIYPVEASKDDPKVAEYIAFIEKLHEKWAKEDATSTTEATTIQSEDKEDSKEVTTQQVTENLRKGEPAYLQIINQLHELRHEEDAKTTTSTTTTEAYQAIPVKNSNPFIVDRDSFMFEVNSMKNRLHFDDSAADSTNTNMESSRNRNFSARFKTNIDTSKYKTIERSPISVRHNLSSRFNSDDEDLPLQKDKTTQTPTISTILARPQVTTEDSKQALPTSYLFANDQTGKEVTTTTARPVRLRGRTRGRSGYSASTTRSSISTTTCCGSGTTPIPLFRRRRPTRITTTSTTTSKPDIVLHRRRNISRLKTAETQGLTHQSPAILKQTQKPNEEVTEKVDVVTPVNSDESEEPKKQRRFQKVQERHVMSEVTFTKFFEPVSDELGSSEESKKSQYEVIGPLTHTDTGHGGNYRHENDKSISSSSEEFSSKARKPDEFYTDPNLALDVNQLKESKKVSTEKNQASNVLLNKDEIKEKVDQKPVTKTNLYPNMARMINRLAELSSEEVASDRYDFEEDTTDKPTFIKDPSRRLYYYAKL